MSTSDLNHISDEDYAAVQAQLEALSRLLVAVDDLDGFIQRAERAEAVGPVLHPSEWIRASSNLRLIIRTARAVQRAQREIRAALEEARR